jgi:SAM-dependent methyltransferase
MPTNMLVFVEGWLRGTLRDPLQHFRKRTVRECPICDYRGYFIAAGPREEARCPNCSSKERDRIFQLYLNESQISISGKKVLHFSPERPFWQRWRSLPGYVSGDVKRNKVANSFVDITMIDYPDEEFDVLICHHVLEHVVEDRKAMAECFRVLKKGGSAFFSVPIDEVTEKTFEPPASMPKKEVEKLIGWDHKRQYGLDFVDRLEAAGFKIEEITYTPEEAERYRLKSDHIRGCSLDRVFVARK